MCLVSGGLTCDLDSALRIGLSTTSSALYPSPHSQLFMEGGGQIPTKASFTLQINDIFNEENQLISVT